MAPPPPATPTPNRFIIPRKHHSGTGTITGAAGSSQRQPQQQQQRETPKSSLPPPSYYYAPVYHPGGNGGGGGGGEGSSQQQFHATPRFSLHSTPRLSQQNRHYHPRQSQQQQQHQQLPSTPAGPPGGHYFRSLRAKNAGSGLGPFEEDLIDSSPPALPGDDTIVYDVDDYEEIGQRSDLDFAQRDGAGLGEQAVAAFASGHASRRVPNDDDVLDSMVTESSPLTGAELENEGLVKHARHTDIQSEDEFGSGSLPEQETFDTRLPKRRRISVSSVPASDDHDDNDDGDDEAVELPFLQSDDQVDTKRGETGHEHVTHVAVGEDEIDMHLEQELEEANAQQDQAEIQKTIEGAPATSTRQISATTATRQQQPQQPTFHRAPRFKQKDAEHNNTGKLHGSDQQYERHYDPLPEAFSPSRRGQKGGSKYVPGGLASELRDWLVDMEAATGTKREGDWLARIAVDEITSSSPAGRGGSGVGGMYLVHGHHITNSEVEIPSETEQVPEAQNHAAHDAMDEDGDDAVADSAEAREPNEYRRQTDTNCRDHSIQQDPLVKIILAGEGRVAPGIAKRRPLKPGVIVGIARPTWEITLGDNLGRWAVACDWALLD